MCVSESNSQIDQVKQGLFKGKVTSNRVIVRDGWYNTSTDLAWWKNYYWLAYHRGTGHHPERNLDLETGNSFAVVLRSSDLRRWHEAKVFDSPRGIVDDSGIGSLHFCATEDRLYGFFPVHTPPQKTFKLPTAISSSDTEENELGEYTEQIEENDYVTWTEDGVNWTEPVLTEFEAGHHRKFHVQHHEGKLYSAMCDMKHVEGPFDLIVSDDGINWRKHAEIAAKTPQNSSEWNFTEEFDLHWRPNGDLWCVVRSYGKAIFYCSKPPYTTWSDGVYLEAIAHAPKMCELDGQVYLAGRCVSPDESSHTTTGLYLLDQGKADLVLTFPTGADCAYPGLISPKPGKLVMSYYSDCAYTRPYSAEGFMPGQIKPKHFPEFIYKRSECDIYLAEIEV